MIETITKRFKNKTSQTNKQNKTNKQKTQFINVRKQTNLSLFVIVFAFSFSFPFIFFSLLSFFISVPFSSFFFGGGGGGGGGGGVVVAYVSREITGGMITLGYLRIYDGKKIMSSIR